jgi:flagellar biosynthesis protein FlhF
MKIRRYVAKEMRLALNQVREEQGPDAVILSSRRVGDGVEVVVAMDYEAESVNSEAEIRAAVSKADAESEYGFMQALERTRAEDAAAAESAAGEMSSELNALRRMLETQLATLAWNDLTRRAPVHTEVLKELSKIGVTPKLAAEFVAQLPARCELHEAQRMALALLSHRVPTAEERWMEHGGMVALIGPTGVGKTSTLAKIAARWVLRHGARELALVSTDTMRIGAQDHIQTIGRLLGAPCYLVDNLANLGATLADLRHRKLVLVDTAGISQRDTRLHPDLAQLCAAHADLECALVLSASAQAGAIEETLARFAPAQAASCVLTKVDEAASLGGVLSAIAIAQLPIAYFCDGQRVAEDIKPARAHQLVARALQLARNAGATADEDLLSRRFGGIAHAIA